MAEPLTAAGVLLAAEEVVSTTVQLTAAGYLLSKPTQPLSATFTQVASFHDAEALGERSVARAKHSVTVVDSRAYIFGGVTGAKGEDALASSDVHVIDFTPPSADEGGKKEEQRGPRYSIIPAIGVGGKPGPGPRQGHGACRFRESVVVFGGVDGRKEPVREEQSVWVFDPESKSWDCWHEFDGGKEEDASATFGGEAKIWAHGEETFVICQKEGKSGCRFSLFDATGLQHGAKSTAAKGIGESSDPSSGRKRWTTLPSLPNTTDSSNTAFHEGHLYAITSTDPLSSELHFFNVADMDAKSTASRREPPTWTTLTFPTHPLNPGPRARHGGALLPLTTGYGRNYLIYLLGVRSSSQPKKQDSSTEDANASPTQWSDIWALQIPSSALAPKPALSLASSIRPAKIKDAIRDKVGADSGTWSWAEVSVEVPEVLGGVGTEIVTGSGVADGEGKLHPGPRALFGADVVPGDGKSSGKVAFWGGEGPDGEKVGDGWVVRFK